MDVKICVHSILYENYVLKISEDGQIEMLDMRLPAVSSPSGYEAPGTQAGNFPAFQKGVKASKGFMGIENFAH